MALVDSIAYSVHLLFAGLWTGTVLFVTVGVLPPALRGNADPDPLGFAVSRLTTISRASAALLFLSGGHMAGTGYTVESLFGSPRGHLVLTMVVLWFVLAALVEVGAGKMRRGLDDRKVRTPAHDARPFFRAASVVALLLLLDAGLLAGGIPF
ncbi:CopD family protein [Halomarina litorea]|uniref:CopD family protein n=1 Tax=Halomarina litorea TaxID=2961595 RepID=UPI0020C1FF19|nr:CopD family protein [Halomarina sp. BCD28]